MLKLAAEAQRRRDAEGNNTNRQDAKRHSNTNQNREKNTAGWGQPAVLFSEGENVLTLRVSGERGRREAPT
jgi:hypothetical protein